MATTIGVFGDDEDARSAVDDLRQNGFPDSTIALSTRRGANRSSTSGTVTGVALGAIMGGVTGLALGAIGSPIPWLPGLIEAGPLTTTLLGIVLGAIIGGILGTLVDLGTPEPQAEEAGARVVVRVDTPTGAAVDQAADIMRRHRAMRLEQAPET